MALTKIPASLLDTSGGLDLQGNITLGDSEKILLGASSDLQIYHDESGGHSRIDDTGTGGLVIRGSQVLLEKYGGGYMINAVADGASELYHAGNKKFETTSGGATVTGDLAVTGDLNITGNVNSTSVTDLDVTDKTITLGAGQTEALSGGSGIIVDGSSASLLWDEANGQWDFNKPINISNSDSKLFELQRSSNIFDLTISDVGDGVAQLWFNAQTNDTGFNFRPKNSSGTNTNALYIAPNGNIGIGTISPQGIFQVNGGGAPSGSNWINLFNNVGGSNPPSVPGGLVFGWNKSNGNGESIIAASAGSAGGSAAPRLDFGLWDGTNYERAMVIDSNARIGINDINPDAYLHVTGKASYTTANSSEVSGLGFVRLQPNSDSEHSLWIHNAGNNLGISGYTDASTSSTRDISLQTYGGNVGIGTDSPSYALDVFDDGEAWIRADSSTATSSTANSGLRFAHAGVNHGVIYHRGADDSLLYFDNIAGSTRFEVNSSGSFILHDDVTYTANAPTHRGSLVLAGASGFTNFGGIEFHTSSGGGAGYGTRIVSSDASLFIGRRFNATGWTESMRIDNNGNVGIGTNGNPAGKFVISNSGAAGFEFTPGITNFSIANTNYIASYDRSASAYRDISFDMNGTEGGSIRFKAGGYVGIGTASPNNQLDVKSQINVTNADNVSLQAIRGSRFGYGASYKCVVLGPVGTSTPDNIAIGYDPSGNPSGSFTGYGKEIIFKNGVEFMTPNDADTSFYNDVFVMKDGKVGIGTSTPDSKLDVNGVINIKSNAVIDSDGTSHYFKTPAGGAMYFYHGTTNIMYVSSAGLLPGADNARDLGSTSLRWRNVYTTDLHLSNEGKPEGNEVDGTTGNWTIQEGEEHLYIINNKSGKKYRFALEEIE